MELGCWEGGKKEVTERAFSAQEDQRAAIKPGTRSLTPSHPVVTSLSPSSFLPPPLNVPHPLSPSSLQLFLPAFPPSLYPLFLASLPSSTHQFIHSRIHVPSTGIYVVSVLALHSTVRTTWRLYRLGYGEQGRR